MKMGAFLQRKKRDTTEQATVWAGPPRREPMDALDAYPCLKTSVSQRLCTNQKLILTG